MTPLEAARVALESGDFRRALDVSRDLEESVDALEVRAAAAYGAGELEAALSAWERLHAVHAAAGRHEDAAWAAVRVALNLLCETGLLAPVRGWVGRTQHHLDGLPVGRVHALLAIVRTYERFLSGDPASALEPALEAVELGTAFGVDPARGLGRVALARLAIHAGDVDRGLALLDELAVGLGLGEFDPLTTGNVYCELICTAQWLGRHDRAREWTDVMERWRHGPAFGATHGRCRVHRAELLRMSGPGDLAEAEALGACAELRPWLRREFGWPLVELGTIRLRRGDLPGAEEAFLAAHQHAWSPQPGLALLRLAQGHAAIAAALVADAIEHPLPVPSKEQPPFGDLRLAPLLEAQAEIASATGDAGAARSAAARLAQIAARYASPWLVAGAALARGRASLLEGDVSEAIVACDTAVATWSELGAPYESAVGRLVSGAAHQRAGNHERARMEWQAARDALEAFGAVLRAQEAAALLDGASGPQDRGTAPPVPLATFRRAGSRRSVCFHGRDALVPDLVGFRYLERLLAEPGREFHALDLVAVEHGTLRARAGAGDPGLPVLDHEARAAYRRRLAEIDEDIEEARACDDLARVDLAERDREFLVAELTRAVGLGGRDRLEGGSAEKARTSVTRSLRYALRRLADVQPDLAGHLDRTVRTGTYCSYLPDPLAPVRWEVGRASS